MKHKKDKTFTMRMSIEIHTILENYANKNYTSMSNIITQLILELKNKDEK